MTERIGPGQSGTFPAYVPEYKNKDSAWHRIEITKVEPGCGIQSWPFQPNPAEILNLLSYDAAMAIAYSFKAARGYGWLEIRLVEYQLTYSIDTKFSGYREIPSELLEMKAKPETE